MLEAILTDLKDEFGGLEVSRDCDIGSIWITEETRVIFKLKEATMEVYLLTPGFTDPHYFDLNEPNSINKMTQTLREFLRCSKQLKPSSAKNSQETAATTTTTAPAPP